MMLLCFIPVCNSPKVLQTVNKVGNKLIPQAKQTTGDDETIKISWLPPDFDPEATDAPQRRATIDLPAEIIPFDVIAHLNQIIPEIDQYGHQENANSNFRWLVDLPKLDQGGLEYIECWADTVFNPRLFVIDLLNKVKSPIKSGSSIYDEEYKIMEGLQKLAITQFC